MPLPLKRLGANAIHVDLDATSLEQGGVASTGGTIVLADVGIACSELLQALSPSVDTSAGAITVAAAKQLSDDPAAMSTNMMWDFVNEAVRVF